MGLFLECHAMPCYTSLYKFNKSNRFWVAHTEQERCPIIQTSVFCVDKICFPRPGHISSENDMEFLIMNSAYILLTVV